MNRKTANIIGAQIVTKPNCVLGLDECRGLSHDNDQSYYYMNYHLFSKVNIDKNNTYVPNGMIADADVPTQAYILQFHPDVIAVGDEAAFSKIKNHIK